jgi:hypothetical protein
MTCQEDMNFEASEDMSCRNIYNIVSIVLVSNPSLSSLDEIAVNCWIHSNSRFDGMTMTRIDSYKMMMTTGGSMASEGSMASDGSMEKEVLTTTAIGSS